MKKPTEDAGKQQERRNRFGIVDEKQQSNHQNVKKVINLKKEIGVDSHLNSGESKRKPVKCRHYPNC
jgi:hypothetical protein